VLILRRGNVWAYGNSSFKAKYVKYFT
jgi:hypothetical protein